MTRVQFDVAALFAGIGGIEMGLKLALGEDVKTNFFCESWEPAQHVLSERFPGVQIRSDVRQLGRLPKDVNLVTAGFPCTDLSQAGRTAGIGGENSGLVSHVFDALADMKTSQGLPTLLIENVPNMLALEQGKAMKYLVDEIESLGYRWAYRVVDSRFTGVPQRRRRVIFIASVDLNPSTVLFADDAGVRDTSDFDEDSFGFYWTEGRGGLGWAQDAVPTLKGGSTLGIPSPPAIWRTEAEPGRKLLRPSIEDAEAMQGFPRGWTDVPGISGGKNGPRWKLVGNAVTVGVAHWVGTRLANPISCDVPSERWEAKGASWPKAAWGGNGEVWKVNEISEFPLHLPYSHLSQIVNWQSAETLSLRAANGFWNRLQQGNLGKFPGFRDDVVSHIKTLSAA